MEPRRLSLKRSLLLSALLAFSFFSATAFAQGNNPTTKPGGQTTTTTGNKNPPTTSTTDNKQTSTTTTSQNAPGTTSISNTGTGKTTSSPSNMPTISGPNGPTQTGKMTGLPTLSRTVDLSIPTYPPPAVPPTQNAPFMQRSSLPDGTVFIAVGAILGAFGATVLVWRGIVACLLHRSVERATMAQHAANDKAAFPAPPAPFFKLADRESSPNLGGGPAGRGQRRTNRGPTPSATPSQSNLFFSPTAPGAGSMGGSSNRDSRFLPSGFYAAGAASPSNGHGHSISLTNLRPDSRGHPRAMGPSPPDSPAFGPSRTTPVPRNTSASSVSLNRPPSGRAPSAFLDDLLDENPHMFPPGGHSHHHSLSRSSLGRY